ncbi:hypothetical protein HDV05_005310 [Chytridiales sp. JEL 0842]|nr:hypothetical protein HDV05_005310 [Chytridiales sp. JEL 0842]
MINATFPGQLFTLPEGRKLFELYSTPDTAIKSFPLGEYADILLDWKASTRFPVSTAVIYFFAVKVINRLIILENSKQLKPRDSKSSTHFKAFVFLHNLLLCLYSAYSFVGSANIVAKSYELRRWKDAYCDRSSETWSAGLNYYAWLFYLSKYYEIIDTVIILLKNRPSSLLQSYHHAGAILTMYFYYAMTSVGIQPPGKKYLTSLQITQFLVGGTMSASYALIPGCMKGPKTLENLEWFTYFFNLAYVLYLTSLFVDFAKRTYGKERKETVAKKTE